MSGDGTHSVRVELTVKDLRQFSGRVYRKRFGAVGTILLCYAPFFVGLFAVVAFMAVDGRVVQLEWGPDLMLAVVLLMTLTSLAVSNYLGHAVWKGQSFVRRPTLLRSTFRGLEWSNDVANGIYEWRGIAEVNADSNYIFVHPDASTAHIIPKRSFETPEAAQEFFETARGYWQAAHDNQ